MDMHNERWLELALFEDRRNFMPGQPTFQELQDERNRMFAANPKTRYIGAHFDWYGNDLAAASKHLESLPNVVLELGAVLYDFGRQPRAAAEFFGRYQDRILFGKDSFAASEFPYYWRVFETNDEYFDYYRDYHAFWKLYGMGLSDDILKKVYYQNALKVVKGLPQSGWPQ
jgi:predicted TIM-barrel fold metal-dependent hydrolase